MSVQIAPRAAAGPAAGLVLPVLAGLSLSHLLNDLVQSLLPSVYPLLKAELHLTFAEIGLITFVFQLTASLLQPVVGFATDRRPRPFSLAFGMACSLTGLMLLSRAHSLWLVLLAAAVIGTGSSIFHPEASRVARMAAGGRFGFAQSFFQVGGNTGQAIGPLLAALVVVPFGQSSIAWFAAAALAGMAVLSAIGRWYGARLAAHGVVAGAARATPPELSRNAKISILILLALTFSKNFYIAGLQSFYAFYLIQKFNLPIQSAQLYLFVFLFAIAAGTLLGGPIGDRFGRKIVLWVSILGVLPFSLALPYAGFEMTIALTAVIGFIMASSFPAIVVYAQELAPGRVGAIGGLFFGFAFGTGGLGAALLGVFADYTSLDFGFKLCAFLPAIGLLMVFMPRTEQSMQHTAARNN